MIFPNKKDRAIRAASLVLALLVLAGAAIRGEALAAAPGHAGAAVATYAAKTDAPAKAHYGKDHYPDLKDPGYGTYVKLDYQEADGSTKYFYDFRSEWHAASARLEGAGVTRTAHRVGFYGVSAKAEGGSIRYTIYNELENVSVKGAQFALYDGSQYNVIESGLGAHEVNAGKLPNGPYALGVWFDYKHADGAVETLCAWTPVYVSNGEAWFAKAVSKASGAAMSGWLHEQRNDLAADDAFQAWMAKHGGDDLKAALRTDNITYPFYSGTTRYPNDTPKWKALAHEICPDKNATDFRKAYLLHEWMSHNLVYDKWKVQNKKELRWSENPDYTTYNIHIGTCFDFSNIYAIMCRELGVPCRVIKDSSINHDYNAVYLDGRWEIMDLVASCDDPVIEGNDAAIKKFWDEWKGPGGKAETANGFLVDASYKYAIHSYETSKYKDVESRIAVLKPLDYELATREALARAGAAYNH